MISRIWKLAEEKVEPILAFLTSLPNVYIRDRYFKPPETVGYQNLYDGRPSACDMEAYIAIHILLLSLLLNPIRFLK